MLTRIPLPAISDGPRSLGTPGGWVGVAFGLG